MCECAFSCLFFLIELIAGRIEHANESGKNKKTKGQLNVKDSIGIHSLMVVLLMKMMMSQLFLKRNFFGRCDVNTLIFVRCVNVGT